MLSIARLTLPKSGYLTKKICVRVVWRFYGGMSEAQFSKHQKSNPVIDHGLRLFYSIILTIASNLDGGHHNLDFSPLDLKSNRRRPLEKHRIKYRYIHAASVACINFK